MWTHTACVTRPKIRMGSVAPDDKDQTTCSRMRQLAVAAGGNRQRRKRVFFSPGVAACPRAGGRTREFEEFLQGSACYLCSGDGARDITARVSFFFFPNRGTLNEERCKRSGMSLRPEVGSLFFAPRPQHGFEIPPPLSR